MPRVEIMGRMPMPRLEITGRMPVPQSAEMLQKVEEKMKRRDFLKGIGLAAANVSMPGLVSAAEAVAAGATGKKPNIVMILVDDLGYGDLSSYGAKDLKSPNIDSLVAAGLRMDNFYANCPVCSPTRAALLTGRYPDLVGVPGVIRTHIQNNWGYVSPHAVFLPKVLKTVGYHTAIVGKWHLPKEWFEKVKKRQKDISDKRAKLVALIEHMDDGIGKVVSALRDSGAADNTLIIFTSDNGGQVNVGGTNGPLRGGKQDMYEGGIKEPFCAVWPGRIKAGGRDTDRVALTMDLYPTMCEAAGASFDHDIDGRSILPTLLGKEQPKEDRYLFWVRREGGHYGGRAYYAARYGEFKLVQNSPFEPLQLFNLKDDPGEQQPLDKNHKMYRQLFGALRNHIIRAGAVPWEKYPVQM